MTTIAAAAAFDVSALVWDKRTMECLATLTPKAQHAARVFLHAVRDTGIDAHIISGSRTYAEQSALYAKGRTAPGPIVTNAPAGYSWHNFALAFDIGIFRDGKYLDESHLYAKAGAIGKAQGLEWGGNWKSITDEPHFQCKTGKTLAQMRQIVKENGGDIAFAFHAISHTCESIDGLLG